MGILRLAVGNHHNNVNCNLGLFDQNKVDYVCSHDGSGYESVDDVGYPSDIVPCLEDSGKASQTSGLLVVAVAVEVEVCRKLSKDVPLFVRNVV